jgi:hypothetical protein
MTFIEFILEKFKIIGLLIIILVILSVSLGKSRWQFYTVYLLFVLYFILVIFNHFQGLELSTSLSRWIIGISVLLVLVSVASLIAFPKSKLPIPSGKFEVATRIYELTDETRDEIYSSEKDDKRKIKYQIWYPTDKTEGYKKAKWIHEGLILTRQLARDMHMPFFMLDHTIQIDSNSYLDAPVVSSIDNYPLVIISHGWKGFRSLHTDLTEELASNGFIAVSIDHSYGSQAVKFEDGSIAILNEEALPDLADQIKYDINANKLVTTYGKDVASVIDDLEKLNINNSDLKGKLDLERIGLLGHSTGGGGDVYIAINDKRVKAFIGLDAWVKPVKSEDLEQGLSIPSLLLRSEQWSVGPNNIGLEVLMDNSEKASLIQINKTTHVDFTMAYMYSPFTKLVGFTGKIGSKKSFEIQREFILNFFDENLRSENVKNENYLEEIVDKYEDVEFVDFE